MLDVPTRYQPRSTIIKAVLRGGLFCCLSARSVCRLYMPVNLFSTSSYFPVNRLPLRYPYASFSLSWQGSRCRRYTASHPLSTRGCLFASPVRHIGVICSPSLACIYLAYPPRHKSAKDAVPPVTCSMRTWPMRCVALAITSATANVYVLFVV